MAKTRQKKEKDVAAIVKKVKENLLTVLASLEGLTVKKAEALRKELRGQDAELVMVKKTLLRRALAELKYEGADIEAIKGLTGLAFSHDEVTAAKVLKTFSKENPQIQLIAGFLEGKSLDQEAIQALASLPTRLELIAKTVATIKAPITGFVNVLGGNLRGLVYALKAIANKKPTT
ncbi:MAG: 50S ribosomal protein L10 [Patescibacteria group bacterium]|nr:50S ribosomal protein L10 [Patescibacteria group bacterium]